MPEKRKSSATDSSKRKPWIDPDDAPELTDEMLDRALYRIDGKLVRRGRPPLGAQPKSSVTLRLDADVLDAYRALGRGWQSQINADLRKVRKLKKA
ncbi:BrnA antitoxin family protein [Rhodopseudomonas palustris]|uniref:BrnA antitoxin family protein n=1 Tax=Rhodopseudomonas palustris TaxID=1076 RepID=UPI0020CEC398|nr:BrnA antitoxin family protein [Rhodopseudomonas palustris]MCP9630708.1 BrnA antitoxin family protein [Rhodopseudomonas palustris]